MKYICYSSVLLSEDTEEELERVVEADSAEDAKRVFISENQGWFRDYFDDRVNDALQNIEAQVSPIQE